MDLKKLRHDLRLSQSDIANLFEVTQGHISNIENGSRDLTRLQYRLLVEKYGADVIAKYADDSEKQVVTVNAPYNKIQGNSAPVQNGDNNQMTSDAATLQVLKQQSDQISKLIDQQDRLIKLMEKMQGL